MGINIESYVDKNAQADISSMTLQQLLTDVSKTSGSFGNMTLNDLQNRYGVKLVKMIDDAYPMPEALFEVPLNQLATPDGINYVIDNTKFDYVFRVAPDLLGDVAKQQLSDKSFGMIRNGNFEELLSGVQMGAFLDTPYDYQNNTFVIKDKNNPTLTEAMSIADLGVLYATMTGSDADVLAGLEYVVGNVKLKTVVSDIDGVVKDKTFGDLFVTNNGVTSISADALIKDVYVGDLLGYTPVFLADGVTVDFWKNANGTKADNVVTAVANIKLEDLVNGSVSYNTIAQYVQGVYVGDLLGYTPVYLADGVTIDCWKDANGAKVDNVVTAVANIKFEDLINGAVNYSAIAQYVQGVYVGDLLGYTPVYLADGVTIDYWKDANGAKVDSIMAVFANVKASDFVDGTISKDKLVQMFGDVQIGEAMGYKKVDGVWIDPATNKQISEIKKLVADLKISQINGSTIKQKLYSVKLGQIVDCKTGLMKALENSTLDTIQTDVLDVKIGVILDYTFDQQNNVWLDKNGNEVSGVIASVAGLSANQLSTGIDDIQIGVVLGMRQKDGVWYMDKQCTTKATGINAILAKYTIGGETGISNGLNKIQFGEIMGLYLGEDNKWYKDEACTILADGLAVSVADLSFDTFNADKLEQIVRGLKIGDLFNTEGSKLFSLISEDTTVENLPVAIENALETIAVQDAIDLGIIQLDADAQAKLDVIFGSYGIDWRTLQLKNFLSKLINAIPVIPLP